MFIRPIAVTALLCLNSAVLAETHNIYAIDSGQTAPDTCWGCCCGTASLTSNPNPILIEDCTYMGGYCMGDSKKAAWIFPIPNSVNEQNVTSITLTGTKSGASGTGTVYVKRVDYSSVGIYAVTQTMGSPDLSMNITWPSSSNYSFNIPTSIMNEGQEQYLMVVARTNVESYTALTNTGAGSAKVVIETLVGVGGCCSSNDVCFQAHQTNCENAGFTFLGEGVECDSNICEDCTADYDDSGTINVDDLLALLSVYGTNDQTHDLNGDNWISVDDVLLMIAVFGDC